MRIVMCENHPEMEALEVVGEVGMCAPCHNYWKFTREALESIVSDQMGDILNHVGSWDYKADTEQICDAVEGFIAARIAGGVEMAQRKGLEEFQSRLRLSKENERLKTALEFYADQETYFAVGFIPDRPCGDIMTDFEPWEHGSDKPGKRARAALKGTT